VKAIVRWIADVIDWVREIIFGKRAGAQASGSAGTDWMAALQGLDFRPAGAGRLRGRQFLF